MMKRHGVSTVLLAVALLCVSAKIVSAQDWLWGLAYGFATPTGNTKDFADDFSWRNFTVEARRINENRTNSLGLNASWNVFFEKSNRTSVLPSVPGSVTGTQYRYINSWPVLLSAHHYFGHPYRMRPYVGINLGGYIIEERVEIGLIAAHETNLHFGGAPEIGITYPRGNQIWWLGARYHAIMKSGHVPDQNYVTVSLGVTSH
jgi:hypothetical protein